MNFHLTSQSYNSKVGIGVAVSTSSNDTCPDSCPLKAKGCYASSGAIAIHWRHVTNGTRGNKWNEFIQQVGKLQRNQLFRHNQAGDLPGKNEKIDSKKLEELTNTIWKKSLRAWSYTHKPMTKSNLNAVKKAIEKGFVINASADTLKEADELKAKGLPVAVTLHRNTPRTSFTPAGNKVVVCPAQYREEVNCSNCQLCLKKNRSVIVGFWAHGRGAKYVESAIDNANK